LKPNETAPNCGRIFIILHHFSSSKDEKRRDSNAVAEIGAEPPFSPLYDGKERRARPLVPDRPSLDIGVNSEISRRREVRTTARSAFAVRLSARQRRAGAGRSLRRCFRGIAFPIAFYQIGTGNADRSLALRIDML
jgi:hypothetical protein